jgi:glycosyltransferase involved in cell wall biosynthesis
LEAHHDLVPDIEFGAHANLSSLAPSPLRVLQVTPRFAPSIGGVETHVREVATRLRSEGIEVSVLTVDETGGLAGKDNVDGVDVSRVAAYPRNKDWMGAPGLPHAIRSGEWDVVHIQSYHTLVAPLAMLTSALAGIPFVLTFHGGGSSSRLRNSLRDAQMRMLGPLVRRASALVAIADFEINNYGQVTGAEASRFVKIPNGADLPESVAEIPEDGKLIISLGRLEQYKGHRRVLEAMPHLLALEPQTRLWLAGAGPDEARLRDLASDFGIADRVEIGATDRVTMAGRLKGASLMVLLSEFESHPLAVLEAASLGVPALVANNSGSAELAAKGYAEAIDLHESPETHAAAMFKCMNSPRPPVRDDIPSWDSCVRDLASLYRSVAGGIGYSQAA